MKSSPHREGSTCGPAACGERGCHPGRLAGSQRGRVARGPPSPTGEADGEGPEMGLGPPQTPCAGTPHRLPSGPRGALLRGGTAADPPPDTGCRCVAEDGTRAPGRRRRPRPRPTPVSPQSLQVTLPEPACSLRPGLVPGSARPLAKGKTEAKPPSARLLVSPAAQRLVSGGQPQLRGSDRHGARGRSQPGWLRGHEHTAGEPAGTALALGAARGSLTGGRAAECPGAKRSHAPRPPPLARQDSELATKCPS